MIIKVKRQATYGAESYWQSFSYDNNGMQTVAGILDTLNQREDLRDVDGKQAGHINWECSCMQEVCGACAMVVNGKPCLACGEFVDTDAEDELVVEPLSKFPVLADLVVDRSCLQEHQKDALVFLGGKRSSDLSELEQQYSVAKCMKCGLCLEVCPNFVGPEGNFYGAILANEAYLMQSLSAERKRDLKKQYNKHFARGCSKSLACRDICPANIPTLSSIGYMNR